MAKRSKVEQAEESNEEASKPPSEGRRNTCKECGKNLDKDKHWHSRLSREVGAEDICCPCAEAAGHKCKIKE